MNHTNDFRAPKNDKPRFQPGDKVKGFRGATKGQTATVIQCDLWGCTLDNGGRYAPETLKRAK